MLANTLNPIRHGAILQKSHFDPDIPIFWLFFATEYYLGLNFITVKTYKGIIVHVS